MGKRKVGALEKIDADLASLQFKIRRDASSYKEDFQKQYYQYETFRELFLQAPTSADDAGIVSLRELIDFVAHVADCYPELTAKFPEDLIGLLTLHHAELQHELRDKVVSSLTLLRNKGVIDSSSLLQTLFPILISTESKSLRALLFRRIVNTIRSANSKSTNHRLNRTTQTLLHNLITSNLSSPKGVWAVRITRELWRRRVWSDEGAVEIMKEASLADNEKLIIGGTTFFLGGDQEREDATLEDSDEDEGVDLSKIRHQINKNKKSKKKENELRKAAATVRKKERQKNQPHPLNFSALHLLRDPQGFAEKLFAKNLQQMKIRLNLAQKLLVLQLVSRLIGLHKLIIISFYSYFQRYLTPRQPDVTSFLASLAQGTHNLVPPDLLEPLVLRIANEFVSEAVASEVAAAGLNAIREICVRQPLAMDETLLQDLVMYRKSKDKSVMMAAKGLLGLYREVGAQLLNKKDRGRVAALGLRNGERQTLRYGEAPAGGIEGIELLEKWKEEERQKRREENGELLGDDGYHVPAGDDVNDDEEDNSDEWEFSANGESDDSGGWIDVSSDDEPVIRIGEGSSNNSKSKSKGKSGKNNATAYGSDCDTEGHPPNSKRARLDVDGIKDQGEDMHQDQDQEQEQKEEEEMKEQKEEEEMKEQKEELEEEEEEEDGIDSEDEEENSNIDNAEDEGNDDEIIDNNDEVPDDSKALYNTIPPPPAGSKTIPTTTTISNPTENTTHHRSLATTRILTPADLSKLNELKAQASVEAMLPFAARRAIQNNKNRSISSSIITTTTNITNITNNTDNDGSTLQPNQNSSANPINRTSAIDGSKSVNAVTYDDPGVTAAKIEAASTVHSARATKEQKILAAKGERRGGGGGREGGRGGGRDGGSGEKRGERQRERQHMSRGAKRAERKRDAGKSSTNKEKERKKNVLMTLGKARGKMRGKAGRGSLVQKGKQLRGLGGGGGNGKGNGNGKGKGKQRR